MRSPAELRRHGAVRGSRPSQDRGDAAGRPDAAYRPDAAGRPDAARRRDAAYRGDAARRGAGRRGLRARFDACRGEDRNRGASAVELAILAPALLFASLLIIQFALWFDARHAALAAAQQGDLVAREDEFVNQAGWAGLAQTAATTYYAGLDTSVLSAVTAKAKPGQANTVSVTVKGKLTGVWPLTITETVTGPIECFRTQVSQGAACG